MRKILFIIAIVFSIQSFGQDTTIATLSIKARLVQTLVKFVKNHDEDTSFTNLYYRWIKKWQVAPASWPSGTTQVSVDSIAVTVIAACYSKALSWPQGASSVGDDFKSDVATIRSNNTYLDRLLDAIDAAFAAELSDTRTRGRALLTATNQ